MKFSTEDTWPVFQGGIIDYFTQVIESMLSKVQQHVQFESLSWSTIQHYSDLKGDLQKVGLIHYKINGGVDQYALDSNESPGFMITDHRKYMLSIQLFPTSFKFEVVKLNDTECTRTFGNIQDAVLYILLLESLRAYGDTRPVFKTES